MAEAIGYCRVSTDELAIHAVSLDAQAEKIRAMAVVHNAELIDIIVDGRVGQELETPRHSTAASAG